VAIEVFWGSGSPYAWRVLLTLEAKGLPYQSRLLEFSKLQHKTPEYLALNPRGRVPTLREGGYVVYESIAIMAYLERKYKAPPLFGTTPEEAGRIWRVVSEAGSYMDGPTEAYTLPLYRGKVIEQAVEIHRALTQLWPELERLEATLRDSPYLAGPTLSAADITVFPLIQAIQRAAGKPGADTFEPQLLPLSQTFPAIAAWMTRVEEIPGYERTYPPHWRTPTP
jgi:glutathione S-transferase